jgi:hypothetical protein
MQPISPLQASGEIEQRRAQGAEKTRGLTPIRAGIMQMFA